jgi:hypothetical protein
MADFNILVGVQSGDAIQKLANVEKGVRRVGNATTKTNAQLKAHASQYNRTAVATNKWAKGALQQAGYQIGDFAVQVQGGTNALQAFGQQGSQLLGIFGPIGAVLGAGVAIAAALGTAFMKASEGAKQAKDAMAELKESTADSNAEIQVLLRGLTSAKELQALERIRDLEKELIPINDKLFVQESRLQKAREDGNKREEQAATKRIESFTRAALRREDAIRAEEKFIDSLKENVAAVQEVKDVNKLLETMMTARTVAGKRMVDLANAENVVMSQVVPKSQLVLDFEQKRADEREGRLNRFFREEEALMSQAVAKSQAMLDLEKQRADIKERMLMTEIKLRFGDEAALMEMPVEIDQTAFNKTENALKKIKKETKEVVAALPRINPELDRLEKLADSVGTSFENAFMSAVDGTMSVKDAFRSMARDIISELYRVFVVKQITGFISGMVMGIGGKPVQGPMLPKAVGGPVSAGQPYLVGERGPELMIPSSNGKIIPNNQLGGGGSVIVNQTINVSTGVQQTVRTEIKSLMPQIAESAKAAVADAKRRGGSYGRAFA